MNTRTLLVLFLAFAEIACRCDAATIVVRGPVVHGSPPAGMSDPFTEGFETSANPPTFFSSSSGGAAVDFNSTSPALTGSESAHIPDAGGTNVVADITLDFADADVVYVGFRVSFSAETASAQTWLRVLDAADTTIAGSEWRTTDKKMIVVATGGSNSSTSATIFAASTEYVFKVKFTKGTGSNARVDLSISTDGSTWAETKSSTDGTSTTQPSKLVWRTLGQMNIAIDLDSVRYSTADFDPSDIP